MTIPNKLNYIIIAIIGMAVIWLGIRLIFGVNNPFYVVASDSMVPKLNIGDLLLIKHANDSIDTSSFRNLKVGDIIVFKSPGIVEETGEHEVIVHRVVAIQSDSTGQIIVKTKGDANDESIPWLDYPIREKNYIGKVIYVLPGVGLIIKTISPPVNYILIAVILVILFLLVKRGRELREKEGQRLR